MSDDRHTEIVRQLFNARRHYDAEGDFHPRLASWVVAIIADRIGGHIADIATGTGLVALEIAILKPDAHVIGIDISEGMLEQAERKRRDLGMSNVEFRPGNAESPIFGEQSLDGLVCCAALVWMQDPRAALRQWGAWLKPGGVCAVQGFTSASFAPAQALKAVAAGRGVHLPFNDITGSPEQFRNLLADTGFAEVEIHRQVLTRRISLAQAMSLWPKSEATPFTGPLYRLSTVERVEARNEFAARLEAVCRDGLIDDRSEALLAVAVPR